MEYNRPAYEKCPLGDVLVIYQSPSHGYKVFEICYAPYDIDWKVYCGNLKYLIKYDLHPAAESIHYEQCIVNRGIH